MTDEPSVEEGLSEDYWDEVWEGVRLPASVSLRRQKEMDRLINLVDYSGKRTAVEVGCAPGRWMAYFNTRLGLESFGIEYAEDSCRLTRKNLELLGVPGHVYHSDLLAFDERAFDVVFSAGVIEHFPDPEIPVKKLAEMCAAGGYVITGIPSFTGINPWISKTFRPRSWAGHFPISLDKMVAMHEAQGLETVYANYKGGGRLSPPFQGNDFAKRFPRLCTVLNVPFKAWNFGVFLLNNAGMFPVSKTLNTGVMYIGRKPG